MSFAAGYRRPLRAYGFDRPSADDRPLLALDVDGVVVLDSDAEVPTTSYAVSAWGKWRRQIEVPDGAREAVHALAERCEMAWASAWSYNAHEALREALDLPEEPWAFLPAQFEAVTAISEYAAGRSWAWITEAGNRPAADPGPGGTIVGVEPAAGLPSVAIDWIFATLGARGPGA